MVSLSSPSLPCWSQEVESGKILITENQTLLSREGIKRSWDFHISAKSDIPTLRRTVSHYNLPLNLPGLIQTCHLPWCILVALRSPKSEVSTHDTYKSVIVLALPHPITCLHLQNFSWVLWVLLFVIYSFKLFSEPFFLLCSNPWKNRWKNDQRHRHWDNLRQIFLPSFLLSSCKFFVKWY